jgi:transcriptional regulator with XRE-family HTH domain
MLAEGLTQQQFADEVEVSQTTVCRLLKGQSKGQGRKYKQVRAFIAKPMETTTSHRDGTVEARVLEAFKKSWDGSDDHADILVKVIEAMTDILHHGD